jgi:hypothetical protein
MQLFEAKSLRKNSSRNFILAYENKSDNPQQNAGHSLLINQGGLTYILLELVQCFTKTCNFLLSYGILLTLPSYLLYLVSWPIWLFHSSMESQSETFWFAVLSIHKDLDLNSQSDGSWTHWLNFVLMGHNEILISSYIYNRGLLLKPDIYFLVSLFNQAAF